MFIPLAMGISAGMSLLEGSRAERAARESQRVQRAEENVSNAAAARQRYREGRVREAMIRQASVNTGVSGSSGEIGSIAAMQNNQAAVEASVARRTSTADSLTALGSEQAKHSRNANLWNTAGSFAVGAFNMASALPTPGAGLDVFGAAEAGFSFAGDPFQ